MWALDAEWKPFAGYKKQGRISLIQLGDNKHVYLFHVIHMKKFPQELARILGDERVLKVGINVGNDGNKIMKDWDVGCTSLVELGALYVQTMEDLPNQRKIRSMDSLARELLGHSVEKVALTRMGNWESKNLSSSQMAYAANDAFVTYEIADKIKQLQTSRPQAYVVPLMTIGAAGKMVVTVRGTLQERENSPASPMDIVETQLRSTTEKKDSAPTTYRSATPDSIQKTSQTSPAKLAKVAPASKWRRKTPVRAAYQAGGESAVSLWSSSPTLEKAEVSSSISSPSPKAPASKTIDTKRDTRTSTRLSSLNEDTNFFYRSNVKTKQAIHYGSRSVVTIIPAKKLQKRSFSHSYCISQSAPMDRNEIQDTIADRQSSRKAGDVFISTRLLPESLEGKDILELVSFKGH
ncbi:hypothetical protein BGZ54_001905 [Gamsiella multidivaricata]|nr:hypothetical protein BGZ54_001905 [Gamsiella multidivaricata]